MIRGQKQMNPIYKLSSTILSLLLCKPFFPGNTFIFQRKFSRNPTIQALWTGSKAQRALKSQASPKLASETRTNKCSSGSKEIVIFKEPWDTS